MIWMLWSFRKQDFGGTVLSWQNLLVIHFSEAEGRKENIWCCFFHQFPTGANDRMITMRVPLNLWKICLIGVYAAIMICTDEAKEAFFYDELNSFIRKVTVADEILILRDFNARLGRDCGAQKVDIGLENATAKVCCYFKCTLDRICSLAVQWPKE